MLQELEKYNDARLKIESYFNGLPHAPASLIKSLINMANPVTGLVVDISWWQLSKLMEVEKRPGRKNAGVPKKERVREYINTIINQCGLYFEIVTVGQKLQFKFTNMPEIYAYYLTNRTEHYTVNSDDIPRPLSHIETDSNDGVTVNSILEHPIEVHTDTPTDCNVVKNINILINKQNKLTGRMDVENGKKSIAVDFHPSQETVDIALSRGLTNVQNPEEIQKFIQHNQAQNTQWMDFNPVFLRWLLRAEEYKKTKQSMHKAEPVSRRKRNECTSHQNNSYPAFMAKVLAENSDACAPSHRFDGYSDDGATFNHEAHFMALDSTDEHLRTALY